jgi:hypothetical protein
VLRIRFAMLNYEAQGRLRSLGVVEGRAHASGSETHRPRRGWVIRGAKLTARDRCAQQRHRYRRAERSRGLQLDRRTGEPPNRVKAALAHN